MITECRVLAPFVGTGISPRTISMQGCRMKYPSIIPIEKTIQGLTTPVRGFKRYLRFGEGKLVQYLPLIILGIVIVVIGLITPNFLTSRNAINILRQSSALGVMAIGMTVVLIGGGIDLSIPSVMAFSGILGAMYMRDGGNPIIAGMIMIFVGTMGGCINGFAVAYLKMIPFVVTLAMMNIAMGASIWVTQQVSIAPIHPAFIDVVMARLSIVPVPVIFLLVVTVMAAYLMKNSIFGRWLYAVGTNVKAARVSGIPSDRVIFGTYVTSGFFAGLAALIVVARLGSAAPTMGQEGVVLDIVSSAVIGGVSIYGGLGNPLGAVIGALFITLITNSMNMLKVSYYTTLVVKGLVIIIAVALDSLKRR
jgi:ribose/xylose/arabinose/galactoside ABC-type transport system permease subunit